jgi:hypothetical protein
MECAYNFRIRPPDSDVMIAINEKEAGKPVLTATFCGKRKTLSDASLLAMLLRHPLMTVKIIVAIHFEAVRLMWKGVQRHAHGVSAPAGAGRDDADNRLRTVRPSTAG